MEKKYIMEKLENNEYELPILRGHSVEVWDK
jgi:hypothetical protein